MNRLIFGLLLAAGVAACVPNARLTRRYKEKQDVVLDTGGIRNYVDVNLFLLEPDPVLAGSRRMVFDLSEAGQAELIKQYARRDTTNEQLIGHLQQPLSPKSLGLLVVDLTRLGRRLVVTVLNNKNSLSDRIFKANVRIQFPDGFDIISCNRLMTIYDQIDLGKLTLTQNNQAELTANASIGTTGVISGTGGTKTTTLDKSKDPNTVTTEGTLGNSNSATTTGTQGITGKISASRTLAEEVLLRQRIVSLNASIRNNTLYLFQQGISGIDLTGNITADVLFGTRDVASEVSYSFAGLTDKLGLPDAAKITVNEQLILFPNFNRDVYVKVNYDAGYREVTNGGRTISESDDVIRALYGSTDAAKPDSVLLIRKEDLRPKLWTLGFIGDPSRFSARIKRPLSSGFGSLFFSSYADAGDFLNWLRAKWTTISGSADRESLGSKGYKFRLPKDSTLTQDNINRLGVMVIISK